MVTPRDGDLGGGLAAQVLRRAVVAQGLLHEALDHRRACRAGSPAGRGTCPAPRRSSSAARRARRWTRTGPGGPARPARPRRAPVRAGEQDLADHVGPCRPRRRPRSPPGGGCMTSPRCSSASLVGVPRRPPGSRTAHRAGHRAQQVLLPELGCPPPARPGSAGRPRTPAAARTPAAKSPPPRSRNPASSSRLSCRMCSSMAGDLPRRERRAHHVTQHRVVRLVQRDQVARAVGVVGAVHVVAQRVDHLLVVTQARLDVLVPRHHPQVTPRVVVDRRSVTQLPVHLVGVVEGRVGQRVVEHRQPARLRGGGRQGRRGGEGHSRPHNQRFRPASLQRLADGKRLRCVERSTKR